MKHLLFWLAFSLTCIGYAQGVKQADLLGTWHVSRMITKGDTIMDITNPNVYLGTAVRKLKVLNPNATKDEEQKMLEQVKQMQDMYFKLFSKVHCTYKSNGTYIATKPNFDGGANEKPETGSYKLISNGTKLTQKKDKQEHEETINVKFQNGVLTFNDTENDITLEFIK